MGLDVAHYSRRAEERATKAAREMVAELEKRVSELERIVRHHIEETPAMCSLAEKNRDAPYLGKTV